MHLPVNRQSVYILKGFFYVNDIAFKQSTTKPATRASPNKRLCTGVINLRTFLRRPLQNNNVELLSSAKSEEHKATTAILSYFHLELTAVIA